MKNIASSLLFLLLWASAYANANVVSVSNGTVIGQMNQRTGPPPSDIGQFTGAPTAKELQNYFNSIANDSVEWWSSTIEYPISNLNAEHQLNFGGVNLTLINDSKTINWELNGFSDNLNIFFVFKNATVADLILATEPTGSVTLSHGLSNWGVFTTIRASGPSVQPVPVPASLWLLSSGLIALISYSRRRTRI
ncbi:MAG TPA: hypothetical protein DCZ48_04950 [Methylococcaceae bacterium]|nr:hypothetical protein [Methylococcaceae bacterium]